MQRLDVLLMKQTGYSREFCKEIIEKGVWANGRKCCKPGEKFSDNAEIIFNAPENIYVSRGGYKLEKAIQIFKPELAGCDCVDAGASTGGFTDCMLKNGAKKVYAIDAGQNQLAEKLRNDPRVICMEKRNIKDISVKDLGEAGLVDFLTADLSFISLTKVLGSLSGLLKPGGTGVLLIKPQFEAGRKYLTKKGVVKDLSVHVEVIAEIYHSALQHGLSPAGITSSPIKGPEGNAEYLVYVKKHGEAQDFTSFAEQARTAVYT